MNKYLKILKLALSNWKIDKVPTLASSLSYYTVFSLAPLLILFITIIGVFLGKSSAKEMILKELSTSIGPAGLQFLNQIVDSTSNNNSGNIIATTIGVVTLLAGALGVIIELKHSLNYIWKSEPKKSNFLSTVKEYTLSMGVVMSIVFLLLVSFIFSAVLGFFTQYLPFNKDLAGIIGLAISYVLVTLIIIGIQKFLPHKKLTFKSIIPGSVFTSTLFVVGQFLIGLYLSKSTFSSAYGAAGSVLIILVWVYYSAQILFFGVEVTKAGIFLKETEGDLKLAKKSSSQPKEESNNTLPEDKKNRKEFVSSNYSQKKYAKFNPLTLISILMTAILVGSRYKKDSKKLLK